MKLTGTRKAALLLTTLDTATATDLLKGQPPEVIQEIAVELSRLEAAGEHGPEQALGVGKQFCGQLQRAIAGDMDVKNFIVSMLKNNTREKPAEIHAQMQKAIHDKDPFIAIAAALPAQIAAVLEDEGPQVIALVLSQLPTKIATKALEKLKEDIAPKILWKMTQPPDVPARVMHRIGEMILRKIIESGQQNAQVKDETAQKQNLRRIAMMLNSIDKEKRTALMEEIEGNDDEVAKAVKELMVTWEDIPRIDDKSLQAILRKVEPSILAKALHGADSGINQKIRDNISERASQMIDEETALMSEPRKKEIADAREETVKPLREANQAEELRFIEDN